MTLVWPSELPSYPLLRGFSETLPDTLIRTSMDEGPAKVRRRTSAGVTNITCSYLLNTAQLTELMDFYNLFTWGGSLSFTHMHPRGINVTCRFRRPPVITMKNSNYFKVDVEFEILP